MPGIGKWIEVMLDVYIMEKLTFLTRLKTDVFQNYWKGWVDCVPIKRRFCDNTLCLIVISLSSSYKLACSMFYFLFVFMYLFIVFVYVTPKRREIFF